MRLLVLGSVLCRSLRCYVQLSPAPGSLELMDFWLDWQVTRALHLRLGHQKIGFTRYRMGSFKGLALVDWSIVAPSFGDERQIGLLAGSTGETLPWLVGSYLRGIFLPGREIGDKFFDLYRGISNLRLHLFSIPEIRRLMRAAGLQLQDIFFINPSRNDLIPSSPFARFRSNGFIVVAKKGNVLHTRSALVKSLYATDEK